MTTKKNERVDLVTEAHRAVAELGAIRKEFAAGKLGSEQATANIGLYNATARVLNTAINAERWVQKQAGK